MKYAERQMEKELFIIGGAQIYKAALALADRLYLTEIQAEISGDAFFPPLSSKNWTTISEQSFKKNTNNDFDFSIKVLDRKRF
jgi:dihydrofolate reductase